MVLLTHHDSVRGINSHHSLQIDAHLVVKMKPLARRLETSMSSTLTDLITYTLHSISYTFCRAYYKLGNCQTMKKGKSVPDILASEGNCKMQVTRSCKMQVMPQNRKLLGTV